MTFIRSLLFALYLIVLTPPYACACFIAFPFMNADRRFRFVRGWPLLVIWAGRLICGMRYRIENGERMDAMLDKPVVLLSKHQSAWETVAYVALMPKPLCFVFKRELLFVPFFGWALGMLKMVHINRKEGTRAFASAARQGRDRLAEGAWIIMFPEGTRTRAGQENPRYKSGGARLAVETGAWVIPMAVNSGRVWPRNSFLKYPGLITISIGMPISSANKTADVLNQEVEAWIEAEMRRIDPESYRRNPSEAAA
ncbi:1-acyl-sn-glycerol-3-phosphate acyltransferase [Cupriavidus sp. OV038]|jgi:1-acyl-sn-glycerol-3-phosphate acyltransferase|uniref:lysophospholipid acyltransferase family protein n=1 Tax=unclassified Cupriavidus TaxID=2640874 RepID=UPI0008E8A7DF|nr:MULTISPECIES: lysophospholipid acyltransferase family protein [unclassified Cupriavidus]SFC85125.1 1-acyl-sn-glycerol-3-phosphate acyltransferase [Cupriavidus sp. OV038]SFO80675.1 1-acyl-sn-glycerol-3-phosphate acyltransferase [Cupriavidus sp. OV096]